jgi:HAD superfamily hydrolase (TIGR01549 family)
MSGATIEAGPPARIQAVIFDLDGTITRPYLDFAAIRAELALDARQPVLEAMETMSPERRAETLAVLERHEEDAARNSELHDGAHEILTALRERHVATGLLTRNSRRSVQTVLRKHGLAFDFIRTREDGALKPSAEPVLAICRALGVSPPCTLTVGDFLFDIQAGATAGAKTALMIGDREPPAFADQADYVIRRLEEVLTIVGQGDRVQVPAVHNRRPEPTVPHREIPDTAPRSPTPGTPTPNPDNA